jgi:hypothetical protein
VEILHEALLRGLRRIVKKSTDYKCSVKCGSYFDHNAIVNNTGGKCELLWILRIWHRTIPNVVICVVYNGELRVEGGSGLSSLELADPKMFDKALELIISYMDPNGPPDIWVSV